MGKQVGLPGDHRVDILYIQGRGFNAVTDKRVVFVDGKVTCLSCHNPYKNQTARLSKSNKGSRLCLTCHRK